MSSSQNESLMNNRRTSGLNQESWRKSSRFFSVCVVVIVCHSSGFLSWTNRFLRKSKEVRPDYLTAKDFQVHSLNGCIYIWVYYSVSKVFTLSWLKPSSALKNSFDNEFVERSENKTNPSVKSKTPEQKKLASQNKTNMRWHVIFHVFWTNDFLCWCECCVYDETAEKSNVSINQSIKMFC